MFYDEFYMHSANALGQAFQTHSTAHTSFKPVSISLVCVFFLPQLKKPALYAEFSIGWRQHMT